MPELPEVHTIVTDLKKAVLGFSIRKTWISPTYPKITNKKSFTAGVSGKKLVGADRIAKNILLHLEDGNHILIHLAMTGRVLLLEPDQRQGKRAHVVFQLQKGGANKLLVFHDTRMFGKVNLLTDSQVDALTLKYGQEPVSENFEIEKLYYKLSSRRAIIKNVLMDQGLIAGMGNIYATEALFLAKIHPQTPVKSLSLIKFSNLIEAAKAVLKQGIKNRGSTLPDEAYVDIWGKPGQNQNYFNIYLKKTCPVCGTNVNYIKINGRGTYFCPSCQPLL